ncbi:unnamed protein product [Lactuca virosa]|uniref:HAT C-terminal dimerisation domain-containing protein n=1 Tax=Lactuca virosa TaxID=75947 RepID=A0AAU9MJT1_9ASTR|nr:unnamed protein product [Lactuca virosa]
MSSVEPNQPNDSNTINDTANSAVNYNKRQIKFTSPMWRHFTYEEINGTKKVVYILVIPISTIASESSFSTSGRIVGPHRSRLLPSTIEVIICTKNWLWAGCVIDGDDVHLDEDDEELEVRLFNLSFCIE